MMQVDEPKTLLELVPFLRGKVAALEATIRQLSTAPAFPVRGGNVSAETAARLEDERDTAIVQWTKSERAQRQKAEESWQKSIALDNAIRAFEDSGSDVDAGPWAKLAEEIKVWRSYWGIPVDGFSKWRSTNVER